MPTTREYEKKDRNVNEPLQFYSGKDPLLFEIVVNSVSVEEPRSPDICRRPRARPLRLLLAITAEWGVSTRLGW